MAQPGQLRARADPALFHTAPGEDKPQAVERIKRAKSICRGCPVRLECFQDAIRADDFVTIRGGVTGHERRILANRARPPARALAL